MARLKYLLLFLIFPLFLNGQASGTPSLLQESKFFYLLDDVNAAGTVTTSFAFSTRKLRSAYAGKALNLRKSNDGSQVDVDFDYRNIVSGNSIVTYTVAGSSGKAIGDTDVLRNYLVGATSVSIATWYDQSINAFHGVQSTLSNQPIFVLNGAGKNNEYAAIQFKGDLRQHVVVNQNLSILLTSSLQGTVGLIAYPTAVSSGTTNNSFGFFNGTDYNQRWSCHLNWSDGNCYTDFGSANETLGRSFGNSGNLNLYKQYTMSRTATTKTVKISGSTIINTTQSINSAAGLTGASTFGVGLSTGNLFAQNGFFGKIPEFILFKTGLTSVQIAALEKNQLDFWKAN